MTLIKSSEKDQPKRLLKEGRKLNFDSPSSPEDKNSWLTFNPNVNISKMKKLFSPHSSRFKISLDKENYSLLKQMKRVIKNRKHLRLNN